MLIFYLGLITFCAAFVQGITGFGFALIAAPLFTLLLTAREGVVIILILTTLINLYLVKLHSKDVELKKLKILGVPTVFGVVSGSLLLSRLSDTSLTVMVSMVAISLVVVLALGYKTKIRSPKLVGLGGVVSGFFNVTLGLGGPPIVLLLEAQHVRKKKMLGDLAAYFLILNVLSLVGVSLTTEVPTGLTTQFLGLIPIAAAGLWLGVRVGERLKERQFHHIVLCLVVVSAIMAFVQLD